MVWFPFTTLGQDLHPVYSCNSETHNIKYTLKYQSKYESGIAALAINTTELSKMCRLHKNYKMHIFSVTHVECVFQLKPYRR